MSARRRALVLLAGYALLSAAIMLPTSLHPVDYKFGSFAISDSFDTIYRLWAETNAAIEQPDGSLHNPMVAAPEGVSVARVRNPVWWTAQAANALAGPVFAYNCAVYLSFLLSALCMHVLIRRITGSDAAALVSATAFSLSPYHILQAGDHIHLAQVWVIPLYFYALQREIEARSWASAAGLSAALAFCFWVHGYYGLFLLIVSPAFFLYALARGQILLERTEVLRLSALAVALVAVALITAASLETADASGPVSGLVERPLWHLQTLGVRWYEWFLPPYYSLVFGDGVSAFLETRMHNSNPAEMTVFLGFVPLALTSVFAFLFYRRLDDLQERKRIGGFAVCLVIAALFALLFSTAPEVEFFGTSVSMPSAWLHSLFPMLRALSRWGILVIFAVSCFAGLALHYGSKGVSSQKTWAASAVFCGLILLEYSPHSARFYLDSTQVPAVYEKVRELPADALVLDLPVTALNDFLPYFWQTRHGKCLYNVPGATHPHSQEVLAFQASDLSGIVSRAKRLGIDAVVIHSQQPLAVGQAFEAPLGRNAIRNPALGYSSLLTISAPADSGDAAPSRPACRRGAGLTRPLGVRVRGDMTRAKRFAEKSR